MKQMIDREEVEPLLIRNTIPICMAQYERAFSTTRVPGLEQDMLVHYESSVSKVGVIFPLTLQIGDNNTHQERRSSLC